MNWLDAVIIITLIGFVTAAFSAGLIREVVTLLSVVLGIVVAGLLYDRLAEDVLAFVDSEDAARAIAFLVLFGAVYLIGQIAAYVLKTGAALLMLGPFDKLGGAAFGLVKGLIVVQILLLVLAAFPALGMDGAVDGSAIGSFFVDDASVLLHVMPGEFRDRIDAFLAPEGGVAAGMVGFAGVIKALLV